MSPGGSDLLRRLPKKVGQISVGVDKQAMEEGDLPSGRELLARLSGCPAEFREPAKFLLRTAPTDMALYLACASMVLVGIERERRTGCAEWKFEAECGSPEMLQSLMFKWGPRFSRHRWTG